MSQRLLFANRLFFLALVFLLQPFPLHAQPQSKDQQKCINALNKNGAKVAAGQGKENTSCIKNATKGKESDPQGCLAADGKGKVAKAQAKTLADEAKNCTETPTFGASDGATVNAAAVSEEIELVGEVFGSSLDGVISTDEVIGKCQAAVSKDYEKIVSTAGKVFLKCTKTTLKFGASDAGVLENCVGSLPGNPKVAKAVSKLEADLSKKCAGVDLDASFSGSCLGRADFAACVGERVICRVCRMLDRMDNLGTDCDSLDNGVLDASCFNQTFVVTKEADTADGSCDADCSLREAIIAANTAAGTDEVIVPAGTYILTLVGAEENLAETGDLDVTSMSIVGIRGNGAGPTVIDGNATDRVLDIFSGAVVVIGGVTVQNGSSGGNGGGIRNFGVATINDCVITENSAGDAGGGIGNDGVATINDCVITENSAGDAGGGISNDGHATITNSTISGNSANGFGIGGVYNFDTGTLTITNSTISDNSAINQTGGVQNQGDATISNSVISQNSAEAVGGIINFGNLTIASSTISDNSAGDRIGGFENSGEATITSSTISGNSASGVIGGIFNFDTGNLTITNSTISGNSSADHTGGFQNQGNATISNSTISGNSAGNGIGGGIYSLGFFSGPGSGSFVLSSTIIADNSPTNCTFTVVPSSGGYNLLDDSSCGLNDASDLQVEDAGLGPLQDNGGPTETHALLPESPAVDAGDDTNCPATDQRGVSRPQGPSCDIGAFELEQ